MSHNIGSMNFKFNIATYNVIQYNILLINKIIRFNHVAGVPTRAATKSAGGLIHPAGGGVA